MSQCQGQTNIYALVAPDNDAGSASNEELKQALDAIQKRVKNDSPAGLAPKVRLIDWETDKAKAIFLKSQLGSIASIVIVTSDSYNIESILKYVQKTGKNIYTFKLKNRKEVVLDDKARLIAETYMKKFPALLSPGAIEPDFEEIEEFVALTK